MNPALPATFSLLACALLAACQPTAPDPVDAKAAQSASPAAAPAPAAAAQTAAVDNAALDRFLSSVYGEGASRTGAWKQAPLQAAFRDNKAAAGKPEKVTRQLCADQSITSGGQPARMIAVCGQPEDHGHPTPGLTDFFLLRMQDGNAVASAQQHFQAFGSMGNPGDVKAMQLGADLWGFVVKSSFMNMGIITADWVMVLPKDGGFHDAGAVRSHISNHGAVPACQEADGACDAPEAFSIDFALDADRGNPGAAHWPLVVTESGRACGKPAQATHRVLLDPATLRYQVPDVLKRETC